MERRKSQLLTTPPLASQWLGTEYLRRRGQINRLDHDARLIALRLLRPERPGYQSSSVFLDLYQIARDVLAGQSVRQKK